MDIQWIKGVPPKDEPECGFHGELCKDSITSCEHYLSFIFILKQYNRPYIWVNIQARMIQLWFAQPLFFIIFICP